MLASLTDETIFTHPGRGITTITESRWSGVMNKIGIRREPAGEEGRAAQANIELLCMRRGMDRARHNQGLRLVDAQQQQRFAGDTGLRYVRTLIEKPSLWLSKRFQEQ